MTSHGFLCLLGLYIDTVHTRQKKKSEKKDFSFQSHRHLSCMCMCGGGEYNDYNDRKIKYKIIRRNREEK